MPDESFYLAFKKRLYVILEGAPKYNLLSRAVVFFIMGLIALNIVAVVLESVESYASSSSHWFYAFELVSVLIFTIEYVLRLWVCNVDPRFNGVIVGRIRYAFTPLALIDLLAFVPFYFPMILALDLRFLRALRLFRLFRLFKLSRYSESLRAIGLVLRTKKEELIIAFSALLVLLLFASSLMYYVENEAQAEAFSSIPAAMWWGVTTLTTVGYGDIRPITPMGKFLGAIISILGIGVFALPAGILASGFSEVIKKRRQSLICPNCGQSIDEVT